MNRLQFVQESIEDFYNIYVEHGIRPDLIAQRYFSGIEILMRNRKEQAILDNDGQETCLVNTDSIKRMMCLDWVPETTLKRSIQTLFDTDILRVANMVMNPGKNIYLIKGKNFIRACGYKWFVDKHDEEAKEANRQACTEEKTSCKGLTKSGTPLARDIKSPCNTLPTFGGANQKSTPSPKSAPPIPPYILDSNILDSNICIEREIDKDFPPSPREAGGEENLFSSFQGGYDPSDLQDARREKKKKGSAERKRKPSEFDSLMNEMDTATDLRSPEEESARRMQISAVIDRAIETDRNFSTYWLQKINAYFPEQNTEFCNFVADEKRRYLQEFVFREMQTLPGFRPEMAEPFIRHYAEHNDRNKLTRFENYAMKGGFSLRDRMEAWAENNKGRLPQAKPGGDRLDRTMQVYAEAKNWAESL